MSSAACAGGPTCRSSSCRRGAQRLTRSPPSTLARTTTSPSPSVWTSFSRGCAPRSAATPLSSDGPATIDTEHFHVDLADRRVTDRAGDPVRLTPTEWALLDVLLRNAGRLVMQKQLLQEVWGPGYGEESNYLRVHMAHLRRKLEPNPSQPRYLITEPGMGYRFVNGAAAEP